MLSRRDLLILIVAIAGLTASLVGLVAHFAEPAVDTSPAASDTSALFASRFSDMQGRQQPMAQWRNQVLIVNFWATWCPPCRDEMPELAALHDKYQAKGMAVLGISTEDAAKTQQFAREMPVSYPLLVAEMDPLSLAESLGNNQSALPYTLILRRDGSVAARYVGRIDPATLERELRPLL